MSVAPQAWVEDDFERTTDQGERQHDGDDAQARRNQEPPRPLSSAAPVASAASSMPPHEMMFGSSSPRKASVVIDRMTMATVSVVLAITSGMTLGRTCLSHLRPVAVAQHLGALDVGTRFDAERLRAHQSCSARP